MDDDYWRIGIDGEIYSKFNYKKSIDDNANLIKSKNSYDNLVIKIDNKKYKLIEVK